MPSLRQDPLSGRELLVAPGRDQRPNEALGDNSPRCPFCPGNESDTPEAVLEIRKSGASDWSVRVVPNLFPIVASGHEVIIETPDHERDLVQLPPDELLLVLQAYRKRYRDLLARAGNRYVAVFRNRGAAAGTSRMHPHSQIVGLPGIPRDVRLMTRRWRRYFARHKRCLLCRSIAEERKDARRMLHDAGGCVAFVSPGGPFPGEILIALSPHASSFPGASDQDLAAFAGALNAALYRLQETGDADYNLVFRTWPSAAIDDSALHWYAEIIPRTATLGGFELATGMSVATLTPEQAARRYRGQA